MARNSAKSPKQRSANQLRAEKLRRDRERQRERYRRSVYEEKRRAELASSGESEEEAVHGDGEVGIDHLPDEHDGVGIDHLPDEHDGPLVPPDNPALDLDVVQVNAPIGGDEAEQNVPEVPLQNPVENHDEQGQAEGIMNLDLERDDDILPVMRPPSEPVQFKLTDPVVGDPEEELVRALTAVRVRTNMSDSSMDSIIKVSTLSGFCAISIHKPMLLTLSMTISGAGISSGYLQDHGGRGETRKTVLP